MAYPYDAKSVTKRALEDALRQGRLAYEPVALISVFGGKLKMENTVRYYHSIPWEAMEENLSTCLNALKKLPKSWAYGVYITERYLGISILSSFGKEDAIMAWVRKHHFTYTVSSEWNPGAGGFYSHLVVIDAYGVKIQFHWFDHR